MDFIPTTILGLFDNSIQFTIPVYQRAYSWQEDNWNDFLSDILGQLGSDNEYSYGSILLEIVEKDAKYDVIDGQQRLTTLIIFMRALYNVLTQKGCKAKDKKVLNDFFKKRGKIRLSTIDNDRAFFTDLIIENKAHEIMSNSQQNIADAKEFFTKRLSDFDLNQLLKVKSIVLKSKVNRLELQGKKEAALMFELQNNRGKHLTNMEKLKSYFMYQMYVNSTAEETESNINHIYDHFKEIYSNVYDIKGLDEDSILIYHCFAYLNISFNYRNLDDIKKELAQSNDKVSWIKEFTRQLSITFANLKKLQSNDTEFYKKIYKVRRKNTLPAFVYPFIIKGYNVIGNDNTKLNILFHILEILVFRYQLISSRADINSRLADPLRNFNGDLNELKSSIQRKLNDSWYWGDNKTKEVLSGWMYENPVSHYLLWEYEESLLAKGYKNGNIEIVNEQIEHISPKRPTNGEPLENGYDVDENNQYSDEFITKYLNCLGNLMLIAGSHNASIGNRPFEEKLSSYEQNFLLNQQKEIKDFLEKDEKTWKQSNIEKRLNTILEFALNRWSFDSIKI